MRNNFKSIALAATLALTNVAFAATTATGGFTSTGTDTLTVDGGFTITLGNSDFTSGDVKTATETTALAYDTQDQSIVSARTISVSLALDGDLTALPDGLTLNVIPTVGVAAQGSSGENGSASFTGSILTAQPLITAIERFTTGGNASVGYSVAATRGFDDFSGVLTYTIAASM